MIKDKNKIRDVLTRGVDTMLPDREALVDLMSKNQITLYQGFDPSMPSLHLGNLVGVKKLSQFQKLGHKVIFLVGDFTGMIGDPTDKLAARKQLTREEVLKNAKTWKEQAGRLLDFKGKNKAEFMYNSKWLDKVSFKDLIKISANFTVQQMMERDMYQKRLEEEKPIHLHEFLYPIAQGYDSVAMNVDLEVGGSDQVFNMLAGRTLMKAMTGKEKFVLGTKLLVDKDGNKVGKTTGNALFLDSTPEAFFGGMMRFPDEVILLSYELLTDIDLKGLEDMISKNPMQEKKNLAFEVVKSLWGEKSAQKALDAFENTFQKNAPVFTTKILFSSKDNTLVSVYSSSQKISKSDAKRRIASGAVQINGKGVKDPLHKVKEGDKIKFGKVFFGTAKKE